MLLLNEADIKNAISMQEAIEVVEGAYAEYSCGNVEMPLRTAFTVDGRGTAFFMPAYLREKRQIGLKVVSAFPGNPALGLPTVTAVVLVVDAETGQVKAIMDGSYLTALRTGAASGVATKYLARGDSEVLGIIGTGRQAPTQVEGVCAVRNIKHVLAYDVSAERLDAFIRRMAPALAASGITLEKTKSADEAVMESDVVVTATTSKTPVFSASSVREGLHINGIGSYTRHMQEIAEDVLRRAAKIVVDSREAAIAEAGDFIVPLETGRLTAGSINGEIGEVVSGRKPGRERPDEITVFKAVGIAVLDVAVAWAVVEKASCLGLGTEISLE